MFNPRHVDFAGHYGLETIPCNVVEDRVGVDGEKMRIAWCWLQIKLRALVGGLAVVVGAEPFRQCFRHSWHEDGSAVERVASFEPWPDVP